MLKAKDLINQSEEELKVQHEDLNREIFELTNELRISHKLDKPHELPEKKRDRARVLTILRKKEKEQLDKG